MPNLIAASDPERISHRAFGLPALEFTESETDWPRKVGMNVVASMQVDMPGGQRHTVFAGDVVHVRPA